MDGEMSRLFHIGQCILDIPRDIKGCCGSGVIFFNGVPTRTDTEYGIPWSPIRKMAYDAMVRPCADCCILCQEMNLQVHPPSGVAKALG